MKAVINISTTDIKKLKGKSLLQAVVDDVNSARVSFWNDFSKRHFNKKLTKKEI